MCDQIPLPHRVSRHLLCRLGEHACTNNCPSSNVYKFEGKERDTETGNDDFGARYYTSRFGRWLSADWSSTPVPVPYANLTNPQTLNLYSMVADDPESFADLDGHDDESLLVKILDVLHLQGSVGVGIGATFKLSGSTVGAEVSMKSQGQLSAAGNITVSTVREAGVSVEVAKAVELGYKKGTETTTVKDNKALDTFEKKSTDVVGFKVAGRSGEASSTNAEIAGSSVCVLLCVGVSVGVDLQKAEKAASAVGDKLANSIKPPAPPPQPPPPPKPPACTAGENKTCP